MLKKLLKSFIAMVCILNVVIMPVFASDVESRGTETIYDITPPSEEEIIQQIKEETAEKWGLEYTGNINVYSEENINQAQSLTPVENYHNLLRAEGRKLVGTTSRSTVPLGWAGNQYDKGVNFTGGGYIYWQEGGTTVSVSFSIGYQAFGIGVSIGNKASGVTGYGAWCKPGVNSKLYVSKDLTFKRYYVESYQGAGVWYKGYVNTQTATRIILDARPV